MTAPTEPAAPEDGRDTPPAATSAPAGAGGLDALAGAERGSGRGGGGGEERDAGWWWRYGFPAVLVLLVLAIPALVYAGTRVVLGSNEGRVVHAITDPAAPGWEAIVDPTPVLALATVDESGDLDAVTVLSLTGEGNGAVVQIPGGTVLEVPVYGPLPLGVLYGEAGDDKLERLRTSVESLLGVGIPEIDLVEPDEWSALVAPVAPLPINNPDEVVSSGGSILFPRAAIDVPASEVWTYLSTQNPNENDLNRMVRVEAFWKAWLARVATDPTGAGVIPGEVDSGLGRFVRGLAQGQATVVTLPLVGEAIGDDADAVFRPQPDEVRSLMKEVVPFPAGPEGTRVRVTVLDGTGRLDHGVGAAVLLAAAGGQIDKVGNAQSFDVTTTQITFYTEINRPRVEALRDALGVGEIVLSDELNSAVDVTVVLGEDYLEAGGAASEAGG